MAFALRCYTCRKRFKWDLTENGWPEACPLCGASVASERADDDIVMPFIRSAKTDRTDKVYRDIEAGSERRVELAAQAAGCAPEDMSSLKITNMADNQREGDIAAKLVTPAGDEGKFFQPNGSSYMQGNASGAVIDPHSGKITSGIAPRAGASAVETIRGAMGQGPWNVATVK